MASYGHIDHPSHDLVVVCACPQAKCSICISRVIQSQVDSGQLRWCICPDCGRPVSALAIRYSHRSMTEWINHGVASLLYAVVHPIARCLPDWFPGVGGCGLLGAIQAHFYQMYFLVLYLGAILYSDYCLVGILAVNVLYLRRRHLQRYDHIEKVRIDPSGPRSEAGNQILLKMDMITVVGSTLYSAGIVGYRFIDSYYCIEAASYFSTLIETW